MRIAEQRLRVSSRSHAVGTFLIIVGCLGIGTAATLSVWVMQDLNSANAFAGATVEKIDIVAVAGVVPSLLSLAVIAAGLHLQTRSIAFVAPDSVQNVDHDDDEKPPKAEPQTKTIDLVAIESNQNLDPDDDRKVREAELVRRLRAAVDQLR